MNLRQLKDYYNTKPVEFVTTSPYDLVENKEFVSRFSLKNVKELANIPINEPIKFSEDLLVKAIKYGMIVLVNYKGEKDSHFAGHERVLYPMVLGRSSKGKMLLRGWHLNGWSVSQKRHINKIWRLFRTDRILSMTFTGSFYRLPPSGYKANDKSMKGGIIAKADFNEIRRNQQKLIDKNKIQNRDDVTIGNTKKYSFTNIMVTDTSSELDLLKPMENPNIASISDINTLRISFCKSVYGNKYIAILGALGQPGNTVSVKTNKDEDLGTYKVLDSITGKTLKAIKNVKGNKIYKLVIFKKKI